MQNKSSFGCERNALGGWNSTHEPSERMLYIMRRKALFTPNWNQKHESKSHTLNMVGSFTPCQVGLNRDKCRVSNNVHTHTWAYWLACCVYFSCKCHNSPSQSVTSAKTIITILAGVWITNQNTLSNTLSHLLTSF